MSENKIRLKYATVCQLMLAGYLIALLVGTHLPPGTAVLSVVEGIDKVCHFSAYMILAGLVATTWQLAVGELTFAHLRWTWLAVAIFGALDEITQIPVGRDCDFWDWTADASGAAVGILLFVGLRRLLASSKTRRDANEQ